MAAYIIWIICLPALVSAGMMLWLSRCSAHAGNRHYSLLSIIQAAVYAGIGLWLANLERPLVLSGSGYFYSDTLAVYEILVTTGVFLLAAVYARGYVASLINQEEIDASLLPVFYGSFCLLELVLILGFLSNNLALLWIFIELSTLLSAVLIVTLKARENITAALKYVFVASTAMLFSFMGIIILFGLSQGTITGGSLNWTDLMAGAAGFNQRAFNIAFILMLIGFGAKSGMAPFHTWLPQAYAKAPSAVSVVYGAVLNLGLYAILRLLALGRQTADASLVSTSLMAAGMLTLGIAAFSLLTRTNTKKVIAFSAVEQTGLTLIGMSLASPLALFWVVFNLLAQPVTKALLFFSAGIWHRQYLSNKFTAVFKPLVLQPLASAGLVTGVAAATGVPLLPVFLVKFNILTGLAQQPLLLILALFFFMVAAGGMGYYLLRCFSQAESQPAPAFNTPLSMKVPVIICLILLAILGVFLPPWLSDMIQTITLELGLAA